jgi:hypothetical protein
MILALAGGVGGAKLSSVLRRNCRRPIESLGIRVCVTDTLMKRAADRARLAQAVMDLAATLLRPTSAI